MTDDRACPAEQELLDFAQGRACPEVTDRIQRHLVNCLKCRTSADLARRAGQTTRRARLGPDPNSTAADELTSTFDPNEEFDVNQLSSSQEVGSIGRLGDYEVLGILGRGGYGFVLRAKDKILGRPVAIKVLEQGFAASAKSRRRFVREARAAAQVNHPNVVTIHAIEEHEGMPFLVMELVNGQSLRDWIRDTPKREFMDILRIGAQIAQGLAAAHAQGVIHRDVKPANVMLEGGAPRVKITDFGLARVAVDDVEMTSRQIMVGTPAYMAPEQFRGEEVDARTDLFALGCVLYSMCAGHSPFHGRTVVEIANLVATHDPPNLADRDHSIPRFLGDMIVRLLEKDPQQRYQSAAEVADVLNRHLTTLNAAPTDEIPRLIRQGMQRQSPLRRRRGPLVATAAVVTGLAAAIWYFAINHSGEHSGGTHKAGQSGQQSGAEEQKATTGGTAAATTGSTQVGTSPPPEKLQSVTVAVDGSGDCQTIGQALARVLPGGKVTVLDAAEYTEPLVVRDAAALSRVQLISEQRAVLKAPPPATVVHIDGVPGFQFSGFKIKAAQGQHGIEVTGENAGTRVHDVEIDRVNNPDGSASHRAAVYLHQAAIGSAEEPIVIDGLVIRDSRVGLVIGDQTAGDPDQVPRNIVIENNRIVGIDESNSALVVLYPCRNVHFHHNLLAKGLYGLSISEGGQHIPQNWQFTHNTCYRLSSFVAWAGPADRPATFTVTDNLLYEVSFVAEVLLEAAAMSDGPERFRNNLWVAPPASGGERLARMAAFADALPFLSTDPASADFLKPDFARLPPNVRRDPVPGKFGTER